MQLSNTAIGNDMPQVVLHIMPASAALDYQTRNYAKIISCAGEGPGLQVFPDSVHEVTQVRIPWHMEFLRGLPSACVFDRGIVFSP